MKAISLYQYIKENLLDTYSLNVLYYRFRKTIADNGFSLRGVTAVEIDDGFFVEAMEVKFDNRFATRRDAFLLLMSIRAIMLDHHIFDICSDNNLVFSPLVGDRFKWLTYQAIIEKYSNKDDDFRFTYSLLLDTFVAKEVSETKQEEFASFTIMPRQRFLMKKYEFLAKCDKPVSYMVISNNAYSFDDKIEDYIIGEEIKYVGNTAFSFCRNLRTITIKNKELIFGKFPIIECPLLKRIAVPEGSLDYYIKQLPYYKGIIVETVFQ